MCFFCGSKDTVKNGRKRGSQTYKCHSCGRTFVGGGRIDDGRLLSDYIEGKQTLSQLAERYGVCVKTVWNHLKSMRHVRVVPKHKDVVVNMDTTYWGRGFGLMVIKDSFLGQEYVHTTATAQRISESEEEHAVAVDVL